MGQLGTYTVTATSFGCSSTASTTVSIAQGQTAQITPVAALCEDNGIVSLVSDIAGGTWTGTGITDATNGIFDPSVAGPGTFTVTFTPSGMCYQPGTTSVTVHAVPQVDFQANAVSGCAPRDIQFTDLTTPTGGTRTWTFGDGNTDNSLYQSVNTYSAGTYTVSLTAEINGCTSSETKTGYISIYPEVDANFSVDHQSTEMTNPNFHFTNGSINASTYYWEFDDGSSSTLENPSHQYAELPGGYSVLLVANNAGNCPDSTRLTVIVNDELVYYVPNSFTPDGDEFNNTFQPVFYSGYDPQNFLLTIFDRWGEVIFESRNAAIGWDGTYNNGLLKEGTYVWKLQFKAMNTDGKHTDSGTVTLIR